MSILPDWHLRQAYSDVFDPFVPESVSEREGQRIPSYGVTHGGYDIRAAPEWLVFTKADHAPDSHAILDPLNPPTEHAHLGQPYIHCPSVILPPHGFALGRSLEYVRMPRDCVAICYNKSTWARLGLDVRTTVMEPGWEGHVTLEFSNGTPRPIRLHANVGIAQFMLIRMAAAPRQSYGEGDGKYQGQTRITLPK